MTSPTSAGRCRLCGKTYSRSGIGRHLTACRTRARIEESVSGTSAKAPEEAYAKVRSFHIVVKDRYDSSYWIHLDTPKASKLRDLNTFLRNIWLECCGHLSAFTISGVMYNSDDTTQFISFGSLLPKNMHVPLYKVLRPGKTFQYEYDFGTTTELVLRVVSEAEMELRQGIHLLARNDVPALTCHSCGSAAATVVCTECIWYEGYDLVQGYLCDKCNTRHDCDGWMLLPVVNSPRIGRCGYTG